MKIVTVKQNSREWREWRGTGLGASDAPSFMGESPWTSVFELWLQKTGLMERPEPNPQQLAAMRRGTELEPVVRDLFEKKIGKKFPPLSAYHDTYEFLRASFDGHNKEMNAILEIKCPNKLDHAKAVKGELPKKYVAQVQQQLLISNAEICYYVSWDGKSDIAVVEVKPDAEYQARLVETAVDFWARVSNQVLPEVRTEDVRKIVEGMQKALDHANKASRVLALLTKEEQ